MSDPIFREGHEFRDSEGKLICRAARDIWQNESVTPDQFKDWQIDEPRMGEILPLGLVKALFKFGDSA